LHQDISEHVASAWTPIVKRKHALTDKDMYKLNTMPIEWTHNYNPVFKIKSSRGTFTWLDPSILRKSRGELLPVGVRHEDKDEYNFQIKNCHANLGMFNMNYTHYLGRKEIYNNIIDSGKIDDHPSTRIALEGHLWIIDSVKNNPSIFYGLLKYLTDACLMIDARNLLIDDNSTTAKYTYYVDFVHKNAHRIRHCATFSTEYDNKYDVYSSIE